MEEIKSDSGSDSFKVRLIETTDLLVKILLQLRGGLQAVYAFVDCMLD